MDKATPAAFKEMVRIMKFTLQTKDHGLRIAPKIDNNNKLHKWTLRIFSDSDWASNKDDRKSITGFVILLCETPILWRSQSQRTVSLSSTEAEYYATAEAAKEIKFVVQVLESLNLQVEKPIIVHIDNVGAIFVAENASATKHTRHIDARYHFVREYIVDGQIKIIFVMSKQNMADIFTKNVIGEIYEEHIDNFIVHREVIKLTSAELQPTGFFDYGGVSERKQHVKAAYLNESKTSYAGGNTTREQRPEYINNYLSGTYVPKYRRVQKLSRTTPEVEI